MALMGYMVATSKWVKGSAAALRVGVGAIRVSMFRQKHMYTLGWGIPATCRHVCKTDSLRTTIFANALLPT